MDPLLLHSSTPPLLRSERTYLSVTGNGKKVFRKKNEKMTFLQESRSIFPLKNACSFGFLWLVSDCIWCVWWRWCQWCAWFSSSVSLKVEKVVFSCWFWFFYKNKTTCRRGVCCIWIFRWRQSFGESFSLICALKLKKNRFFSCRFFLLWYDFERKRKEKWGNRTWNRFFYLQKTECKWKRDAEKAASGKMLNLGTQNVVFVALCKSFDLQETRERSFYSTRPL